MALLHKKTGEYIVVDLQSSIINSKGLHVGHIRYKSREDRKKDKELAIMHNELMNNIYLFLQEKGIEDLGDQESDSYKENKEVIDAISYLLMNQDKLFYRTPEMEEFNIDNELIREIYDTFGLDKKYVDNPVNIIHSGKLTIDSKHTTGFNGENFYPKLRDYLGSDEYEDI